MIHNIYMYLQFISICFCTALLSRLETSKFLYVRVYLVRVAKAGSNYPATWLRLTKKIRNISMTTREIKVDIHLFATNSKVKV
jgi:hypothetical protein